MQISRMLFRPLTMGRLDFVLLFSWLCSVVEPEKFTIQELLTTRFPHKISDDIYMDPCKGCEYIIQINFLILTEVSESSELMFRHLP